MSVNFETLETNDISLEDENKNQRSMLKKRNKYEVNRFKTQCRKQQQRESKLYLQSDIKISYVVK